jgi:hypothetical protein
MKLFTSSGERMRIFSLALQPQFGPWATSMKLSVSLRFTRSLHSVVLLGRVISSSQGLYISTDQHEHRINAYTHQTSMPYVGFEPTIPTSERANTVHALDRSASVTSERMGLHLLNWVRLINVLSV